MTKVTVESDEPFGSALERSEKRCEKAGLLSELKKHQRHEKPQRRERVAD